MVTSHAGWGRLIVRVAAVPLVALGGWHPLHTTITTVAYDATAHTATATIRIFADDLARAVEQGLGTKRAAGQAAGPAADTAAVEYIRRKFTIANRDGRPVPLLSCGIRVTGDLRWICLRASLPQGLSDVRIGDAVLTDVYADQVNVVMTEDGGRHGSLLFTRGDGPKPAGG
jgi:hypothetical protein